MSKTSTAKIPKDLLNLAGEFRVCSELYKRGLYAAVTYGNRKSVDIYVFCGLNKRTVRVEVKTSQQSTIPTGIYQKWKNPLGALDAPDFWVLVQILSHAQGRFTERFFVLTHREICKEQSAANRIYDDTYFANHGRHFDIAKGMDKLKVKDIKEYEEEWSKIIDDKRLKGNGS